MRQKKKGRNLTFFSPFRRLSPCKRLNQRPQKANEYQQTKKKEKRKKFKEKECFWIFLIFATLKRKKQ
jgi:hypothetical protein